ncbi:ribonuclease inhibitor [Tamandua tetradactyla]|uniref:ribonuclease inhibitor n=1 Tax=Tamandua tetradactyla TaxID=48850 RepID=UPI0040547AAD
MSLDLQYEQLSEARWAELLPLMPQYNVIRLDDCGLTEAWCADLSRALQASTCLEELSLRCGALGNAGAGLVLRSLQDSPCAIRTLSLQDCGLTGAGCAALPAVLRALPTLRELNLSDNALGDAGLRLLCEGLLDAPCTLEKLKLESCGATSASCKELGSIVAAKDSLQELALGDNKLGDAGIAALCPALLSPSSRLKVLWLWECDVTAEGCRDLCRVLRAKESLRELSVAGNELGDRGAQLLCEGLREPSCQLESLWVKTCGLTAASCPHFAAVLTHNRALQELQMSSNKLGDAGVQQLCQSLSQPGTTLRVLWLGDCDVTDRGCAALAALLLSSPSLRELDLSNNPMGDPGVLQLVQSLQQPGCALEQLVLYDIYWTAQADERLSALEQSKPNLRIIC